MITTIHFLRPEWLYALLPLAILLWLLWRRRLSGSSWHRSSWRGVVDPRLLPHVLIGESAKRQPWVLAALALGGVLSILAMAGPAWQKLEVPVFRQPSALVVLLDLSRSMDAADIKPSRLLRAQMKLQDILKQQKEGETALIVYAASAFVVSPLTSDANTIASQVNSLSTELMPAQGSRPDRAISLAKQLLQQSGVSHGGVLLISDGLDGDEPGEELKNAIKSLLDAGHRLSVLGVGSAEGAPIAAAKGGFLKDRHGVIILPKLDDAGLEAMASLGHGSYRRLSTDDNDIHAVLAPFKHGLSQQQNDQVEGMNSDQWRDEGPWLLLPLLMLGVLAFRRGYLLILIIFILPLPRPAYALDWDSLWQRDDQRAQQALRDNQPQQAAQLFKDTEWRAAAHYRAGNYPAAEQDLQGIDSTEAYYNRGNAYAQQGKLPEAMSAFDEALKRNPKHDDAKFNRDLVEQMMKQSQQNQEQDQQQNEQEKNQQNKSEGKGEQDQSTQSGAGQSGSGQSDAEKSKQADNKADQHADTKQQGTEKQGNDAGESKQQKSGEDAVAQQQSARKEAGQQEAGQQEKSPAGAEMKKDGGDENDNPKSLADGQSATNEMQQADQQWLRRIPDDPGGLWRRKFLYQYKQQAHKNEDKTW